MKTFRMSVPGRWMTGWYLGITIWFVIWVLHVAPHFSYSLDDPYIHLALAQNILHGTYGINPHETVSPSSSILWPFLLAPLSTSAVREWVPFALNVLCSLLTCAVMGAFLEPRLRKAGVGTPAIALMALLIMITANMVGLTLTGMEHSLQILLITGCAIGCVLAYEGQGVPTACLLAAALAPAVRYEDLAFTGALCAALWLRGRRNLATGIFLGSLVPIVLLGLFLQAHGLAFFPNSVLAKGKVMARSSGQHFAALTNLRHAAQENLRHYFGSLQSDRLAITALLLALILLVWKQRSARSARVMIPAIGATFAMMLVGPYGWFYRYDVCIRVFLFVLVFSQLLRVLPRLRIAQWACLAIACSGFLPALIRAPDGCVMVARQQYEMHRFLTGYAQVNTAVNDLGWVSLDARGRYFILDLYGLGSDEALHTPQNEKDETWMDDMTRRHNIQLVMIYPNWFAGIPDRWIELGDLHQDPLRYRGFVAGDDVMLYATTPEAALRLKPKVAAFAATLPSGVYLTQ